MSTDWFSSLDIAGSVPDLSLQIWLRELPDSHKIEVSYGTLLIKLVERTLHLKDLLKSRPNLFEIIQFEVDKNVLLHNHLIGFGNYTRESEESPLTPRAYDPRDQAQKHLEIIQRTIPMLQPYQLSILPSQDLSGHMKICDQCEKQLLEDDRKFEHIIGIMNQSIFRARYGHIVELANFVHNGKKRND